MFDKKYTGFITRHGVLHLYEHEDDLRKDLSAWKDGGDFSMIAWIDKTVVHKKGDCASEAYD